MKTLVIICSFLFVTETYQIQGLAEYKPDATLPTNGLGYGKGVNDLSALGAAINQPGTPNTDKHTSAVGTAAIPARSNLMALIGEQTNPNLKEKADKIRETAKKEKEAALSKIKSNYEQFKEKLQKILESADKERLKEVKLVELEHMKADIIAAAIWRNAHQKWASVQENIERQYREAQSIVEQKKAELQEAREPTLQGIDQQFVRTYTQVEESRKKIESVKQEALAKGRAAHENAIQSAEERKSRADAEFQNAVANHDSMSLQEWLKIIAKYDADMDAYERAVQEADGEWQNVLDTVGIGKQYKEIVNAAVAQLVNSYKKIEQFVKTETEEYEDDLREVQKSRDDVTKMASAGKEKADRELREALEKAKNEAQKKYDSINKKTDKKKLSAVIYTKKVAGEFQKMQNNVLQRFDEAMKAASALENKLKIPPEAVAYVDHP